MASLIETPAPRGRILDAEEERALVRRTQTGDRAARARLVQSCLPFVASVALEYRRWGHPLEDIVQEGCIGLLKAIERFDPDRGCRLITYAAYWIRAEIRAFVVKAYRLVRIGTSKGERRALRYYRKTRERDPEELARASGISVARAEALLPALTNREASLDDRDPDRGSVIERMSSDEATPEEDVGLREAQAKRAAALADAMRALPEREQTILRHRYFDADPQTLDQIGRAFGISKERVRQLEERAMRRVRESLSSELAICA